jgi:hypothetical protein
VSNKALYAAAAIFLIVLGVYYIYDKGKTPVTPGTSASATPAPQGSPIVSLDPNQISQVDIKANGKVLTVVRSNLTFTYKVCPADQPAACQPQVADTTASIQLFTGIVQLRPSRTIFGVTDQLPGFGLDKPTAGEFTVTTASGQKTTFWVGGKTTDGVNDYLRRPDGGDVYAIPAASIDGPILGLVDKPPVPQPSPGPGASASPAGASPAASP